MDIEDNGAKIGIIKPDFGFKQGFRSWFILQHYKEDDSYNYVPFITYAVSEINSKEAINR